MTSPGFQLFATRSTPAAAAGSARKAEKSAAEKSAAEKSDGAAEGSAESSSAEPAESNTLPDVDHAETASLLENHFSRVALAPLR